MKKEQNTFQKLPFYYGWIIVGAGTLGMLLSIPGQTLGVSVFTDFLIEALGLSRDQLSLAYMIGTLASASILSFSGLLLDRWGSRKFGSIVATLLGLTLIGLSFIDDVVLWLQSSLKSIPPGITAMILMSLGFFFLRFLGQGSLTLVSRNLPMKWFTRRRGMVSAFVGTFVSFVFNVAPTLFDWLIAASGWKVAWRICGLVVMIVGTAMYTFLVRDNPESLGLKQDGFSPEETTESESKTESQESQKDLNPVIDLDLRAALKTPHFWVFGLSLGLASLYVTGFTFHVVSIFQEAGIDRTVAVSVFIPVSIVSVVLNIAVSTISDHIRLKWILLLQVGGLIISMLSVSFLSLGGIFTVLIIISNGLSGGTFNALTTLVWPRFFGTKHLGSISGFAMGILVAGSALGPILLSLSLSITGSYGKAALLLAGLGGILFLWTLILQEEKPAVVRKRIEVGTTAD